VTKNKMTNSEESFALFLLDKWERLRRHFDYRLFCRKYREVFDDIDGILMAGIGFLDDPEANVQLQKIKKRFAVKMVFHCDCDLSASDLFAVLPVFKAPLPVDAGFIKQVNGNLILSFVKESPFVDCRINLSPAYSLEEIENQLAMIIAHARIELYGKHGRCRNKPPHEWNISYSIVLHDDGNLYCRIETLPNGSIRGVAKKITRRVQREREKLHRVTCRQRFEKNMDAYRLYDLWLRGMKFTAMWKKLRIDPKSAQKKVRRACELIYGQKFTADLKFKIKESYLAECGRWEDILKLKTSPDVLDEAIELRTTEEYHHGGGTGIESRAEARMALSRLKTMCESCPDRECSQKMLTALSEGEPPSMPPQCDKLLELCPMQ